jgi:hypothetical protein
MSKIVYIVQEFGWEYNDEYFEIVSGTPKKAFLTYEQADSHRRVLERQARREWEVEWSEMDFPVCFESTDSHDHPFSSLTSLTWDAFQEKVRAFPLPPFEYPESEGIDLYEEKAFWKAVNALPEEQYHAFYDLLDGLNFYEVVAIEVIE